MDASKAIINHSVTIASRSRHGRSLISPRFGHIPICGGKMPSSPVGRRARRRAAALCAVALITVVAALPAQSDEPSTANDQPKTATPIKHVVVFIGENRSFDHVYGTYVPKSDDSILNLLSEGIVRPDGAPGRHFASAKQFTTSGQTSYFIGVLKKNKTAYTTLPDPTLGGAPNVASMTMPPFTGFTDAQLAAIEPSLEPSDLFLLTTGATGAAGTTGPDARITNDASLPNGPFQLTGLQHSQRHRRQSDRLPQRSLPVRHHHLCRPDGQRWRHLDGVLQYAGRGCAAIQEAGGRIHDQRQLPPAGPRRHRHPARLPRHRRRHLLERWERQPDGAADHANRQPQSAARHQQPIHCRWTV